jgi:hypothetical protein
LTALLDPSCEAESLLDGTTLATTLPCTALLFAVVFEVTAPDAAPLDVPLLGLAPPNVDCSHCQAESTGLDPEESSGVQTPVAGTLNPLDPPEELSELPEP